MIIIYTPEGGEPQEFDASTLKVSEVSIVQRTIDMKWDEIKEGLAVEDLDAMRGISWVLKKRTHPALRFADHDPGINEMVTRLDKQEVRSWVEGVLSTAAGNPEATPERIAAALAELPDAAHDPEHARQLIAEMTAAPKEPAPESEETSGPDESPSRMSSSPEPSTSDSSPTSSTSLLEPSTT